jgi:hypothetical protein
LSPPEVPWSLDGKALRDDIRKRIWGGSWNR